MHSTLLDHCTAHNRSTAVLNEKKEDKKARIILMRISAAVYVRILRLLHLVAQCADLTISDCSNCSGLGQAQLPRLKRANSQD